LSDGIQAAQAGILEIGDIHVNSLAQEGEGMEEVVAALDGHRDPHPTADELIESASHG